MHVTPYTLHQHFPRGFSSLGPRQRRSKENPQGRQCFKTSVIINLKSNKKTKSPQQALRAFVPRTGIEPALSCENQILSLTRLPIPPSGLAAYKREAILRIWYILSKMRCKYFFL